jgi:adenosylcobinamide-GDP ribazoletransferase
MKGDDTSSSEFGDVGDDLKNAIVFLTRLPAHVVGVDPHKAPDFRRGARVFPVVGALIGVAGGAVLIVAAFLGMPPLVSAALAVAATMILTGALHEDGLADTADGFGGSTGERRLEIMDDSRVGTYGAAALVLSVVLRVAALAAIAGRGGFAAALVLIAGEAASRAALVRVWYDLPAARMSGLAHETGPPDENAMLIALATAVAIVIVTALPSIGLRATLLGCVLAAIATYGFIRLTARAIGGRTGDSLGACQQVAMIAFLIGAAAT